MMDMEQKQRNQAKHDVSADRFFIGHVPSLAYTGATILLPTARIRYDGYDVYNYLH